MATELFVAGYEAFRERLNELKSQGHKAIYVLFTGEKVDGVSSLFVLCFVPFDTINLPPPPPES